MEQRSPAATVTATRLVRDLPEIRKIAEAGPVHITSHGRTELVLITPQMLERLGDADQGDRNDAATLDAKLNGVMDAVDAAIVILDAEMRIRRYNEGFLALADPATTNLVGRQFQELAVTPNEQYIAQQAIEVIRTKRGETLNMPSPNAPDRHLSIVIRPWLNGAILISSDVTERVKSQDQTMSRIAFETAGAALGGIGHIMVRSCGTIIWASQGLADMCDTSKALMEGSRVQHIFDPRDREAVESAITSKSTKPRRLTARFLLGGTRMTTVQLAISSYWSREHHDCAAIVMQLEAQAH